MSRTGRNLNLVRYGVSGPVNIGDARLRQRVFDWDLFQGTYIKPFQNQRGNTPGYPAEFHFLGLPYYSKNNCSPEYVDIHADGAEIIRQDGKQIAYNMDNYQSLVYDYPFDPTYQKMVSSFLAQVGYYTEDNSKYYPEPHAKFY